MLVSHWGLSNIRRHEI